MSGKLDKNIQEQIIIQKEEFQNVLWWYFKRFQFFYSPYSFVVFVNNKAHMCFSLWTILDQTGPYCIILYNTGQHWTILDHMGQYRTKVIWNFKLSPILVSVSRYRVIHNDWKKVWASYSGQNTSCDMGEVYFFQWDHNILKLCFQKFQGGSCIFQVWLAGTLMLKFENVQNRFEIKD